MSSSAPAPLVREASTRFRRATNVALLKAVYAYLAGTKSTGGEPDTGPNAVRLLEAVQSSLDDNGDPLGALPMSDMPGPQFTKPTTALFLAIGRGDLLLLKTIIEGTKVLSRPPESALNAVIHVSKAYWSTKDTAMHGKIVEVAAGFVRRAPEIRVVPPEVIVEEAAGATTTTAAATATASTTASSPATTTTTRTATTAAVVAAARTGDTGSSASPPAVPSPASSVARSIFAAAAAATRATAVNTNTAAAVDELCGFARAGKQADVERLLEAGVSVEGRHSVTKRTPLAEAVIASEDKLTRFLVDEANADVKVRLADGAPVLMSALGDTTRDGSELVRFLLSRGAADDFTPEEWAAAHSAARFPIMTYWLKLASEITPPTPAEKKDLESVGLKHLHGLMFSCVGQEAAKRSIVAAVRRWRYFSPNRPLVLCLAGPAGHGKSVAGKALAAALGIDISKGENDGGGYCSVDLGQLGTSEALLGTEPKYRGGEGGTKLGNFLHRNSGKACVVQLDELDKVEARHADVFSLLYPIFEDGCFHYKPRGGVHVDTSKAVFILTTNWGSGQRPLYLLRVMTELEEQLRDSMLSELRKVGKDALVSRIDLVVPFVPFTDEETRLIAEEALQELLRRVARPPKPVVGHLALSYDGVVVDFIADRYRVLEGARSLRRALEKSVQTPLAAYFNSASLPAHSSARLVLTGPRKQLGTHVNIVLDSEEDESGASGVAASTNASAGAGAGGAIDTPAASVLSSPMPSFE